MMFFLKLLKYLGLKWLSSPSDFLLFSIGTPPKKLQILQILQILKDLLRCPANIPIGPLECFPNNDYVASLSKDTTGNDTKNTQNLAINFERL